jgi:hypothetical protein
MTDFEKTAEQMAQASADYAMINHFLRCNLNSDSDYAEYSAALDRIYTRAKQTYKPIAWMDADDNLFYTEEDAFKTGVKPIRPLLSGPEQIAPNYNATSDERLMEIPKREWIGLTEDEIHAIYDRVARQEPYSMAVTRRSIGRAIEQALREKNT